MSGMAGSLGHHVQNAAYVAEPPVGPTLDRPPGWRAVQGSGGKDPVRMFEFLPVKVEYRTGGYLHGHLPGVAFGLGSVEINLFTCDDGARNQNRSTSIARCRTIPTQVQP